MCVDVCVGNIIIRRVSSVCLIVASCTCTSTLGGNFIDGEDLQSQEVGVPGSLHAFTGRFVILLRILLSLYMHA